MKVTRNYYELQPRKKQQDTFNRKTEVKLEEITTPATLLLDQASNGGYAIYDSESRLFMSGVFQRGHTRLPEFKKNFVDYISELVDYYEVDTIFHEETFQGNNITTTEVLFYLKHAIQDLGYFKEGIEVLGLNNRRWKNELAKPETFKYGKGDADKIEVRKWVKKIYPLIAVTVQDEFDAIGMGIAIMVKGKGKQNFYKQATYNKKLPVNFMVYDNAFKNVEKDIGEIKGEDIFEELREKEEEIEVHNSKIVEKLRKPFRTAYQEGGIVELELNKRRPVESTFRQFLHHKDVLAFVRIPSDYKYWGIHLLDHGETPERFETEEGKNGEFILIGARKKRL